MLRFVLGAAVLLCVVHCNKESPPVPPTRLETNSDVQALTDRVLAVDFTAIRDARLLGARAEAPLTALAHHQEARVRELALRCFDAIGGSAAESALVNALLDSDREVRIAAYQGLFHHASARSSSGLLDALRRSDDPLVQKHVALIFAQVEGLKLEELRRACETVRDPEAVEGCFVGRAKLGDAEARAELIRRLTSAELEQRAAYLKSAEEIRIRDEWLLGGLVSLLEDRTRVRRIGVDGIPGVPEYLRVCDLAVNLIAAILHESWPFIDGKTNYTAAQIELVRRAAVARAPRNP